MENNETMMNNEVNERTDETKNGKTVSGGTIAFGIGLAGLAVCFGVKKYKEAKAKREQKQIELIESVVRNYLKDQAQEAQFEECCEEIPEEK